ncbi:MAG: HIRAN domain-containing protein, partial [Actinomycetota bacterium]|nr:HIRAN domain-containing protein [Actinomycetota bacterium]
AGEVGDMLKEGSHLILRRESNNPYDDKAIAILDLDQNKLGYLPQRKNEIISRLMDAGKAIYAVVENKQKNGDYLQIGIKVYMREY